MKKYNKISIVALMLFSFNVLWAQSPHKMSYQAVVRNSSFALVVNAQVGMKVSILQGTTTGAVVYSETQLTTSNGNGLVTIEIGGGTVVSGAMNTINWGAGPFFIKTETDPNGGSNYSITNTTQFLSVPYSLYSLNSGTSASTAGNCYECHVHDKYTAGVGYKGSLAEKRDNAKQSFEFSKHAEGETAFGEGTNSGCAACHGAQGFDYRIKNNLQPTYVAGTAPGTFTFSFSVDAASSSAMSGLPGHIGCFSCHKGNPADSMGFVYTDSVKLLFYSMPGKEKFVNLKQNKGKANLCILCHQNRPISQNTTAGDGSSVDYPALAANLTGIFYDSTKTTALGGNKISISASTIGHNGWPGNAFLGKGFGPIEIPGTTPYTNSAHTTVASCNDCHMASPKVISGIPVGGHTFNVSASITDTARNINYNGCNTAACHGTSGALTASSTKMRTAIYNQRAKLDQLAELLKYKGLYLVAIDTAFATDLITRTNLWYKFTTKHFSGRYNIGTIAGTFVVNGTSVANPVAGAYRFPTLTNGQFACLQAFTVGIREQSGGIHNTQYTNALLSNAIEYLTNNPIQ